MATNADHRSRVSRLRRIEGQVGGVARMVEEGRYCIDILQQLAAARKALDGVGLDIMKGHINHCVTKAIRGKGGKEKVDELMETLRRYL